MQMQRAVIRIATSQRRKQAAPVRSRSLEKVLYVRAIGGCVVCTVLKWYFPAHFEALDLAKGISDVWSASDGRRAKSDAGRDLKDC